MNTIEIAVKGPTGAGKSHVMNVIKKALQAEYGPHVQVASYDLSVELNLVGEANLAKPVPSETVFVLREENQDRPLPRPRSPSGGVAVG